MCQSFFFSAFLWASPLCSILSLLISVVGFSVQFQTQCFGSLGPPGMLWQFAYPKHLHAGLSHGLVILDRAPTRADGANQHTVLIYDRQTSWEGD